MCNNEQRKTNKENNTDYSL